MTSQLLFLDLPMALHRLAACLLCVALAWSGLVAALASWQPTARWARALTPRVLHAALFTAVSGGLAISPAHAAGDLDGLPLPSRGVTAVPTAAETGAHVVAAGDCLWSIAKDALPPDAGTEATARESAAWYRRNRAVIGDDPDLILPGQVLAAPESVR